MLVKMKFKELKNMEKDALQKKLDSLKLDLLKLNKQVSTGTTLKNTKEIREIKKTIARIKTLLNTKK